MENVFFDLFLCTFKSALKPSTHYPESNGPKIFEIKKDMRSQQCAKGDHYKSSAHINKYRRQLYYPLECFPIDFLFFF